MNKITDAAVDPVPESARTFSDRVEADQEDFKPLTREQAQQLRKSHPQVSLWRVLAGQLAAGLVVAALAWAVTGKPGPGWSALYGSLSVVIPAALFARGLTGKVWSMNPGTAVAGFFLWELVKVALTLAMLFAAPRLVPMLSWPIMLIGLVVTMKVSWFALFLAARHQKL